MEHPKKILFIHHGKGLGGAPLSLLYLVQQLPRQLYQPVVAFLHDSAVLALFKKNNISTIGPLGWYDFPHTKVWWFSWYHTHHLCRALLHTVVTLFFIAPRLYRREQPALVHLNTSSLIAWGAAAWFMHVPVVWHIREPLADGYFGIRKAFIRWCVQTFATKIIAISNHDGQPWAHSKKLSVIYNAVPADRFDYRIDPKAFCHAHQLKNAQRILFVGGCSREKGTLPLLQAFELLLQKLPTTQLLVAGYMPEYIVPLFHPCGASFRTHVLYFDKLRRSGIKQFLSTFSNLTTSPSARFKANVMTLIEKLNYSAPPEPVEIQNVSSERRPAGVEERKQNNVVLLGSIEDIPGAMASADIIVFPATAGHFARPIIEAGFMKKPVIASQLAPLDELVINNTTGLLVEPNSPKVLADALETLLTDPQQCATMGQAGYDYCTTKFSLLHQRSKIMQIYANLLKGDHYEPLGS